MKKRFCRILSVVLLLFIITGILPMRSSATEDIPLIANTESPIETTPPLDTAITQQLITEPTEETQAVIVREDVSLREEFTKHFEMSDGSYTATVYNEPVHQLVDGTWIEVDNSLTLSSTKGMAQYKTVNGLTDVSFAQNFGDKLVTMEQDDHFITWGVEATIDTLETMAVASAQLTDNLREPAQAELLPLDLSAVAAEEQKLFATKATSTIQYADALANGVDLEYTVLPSRIKESIILNSPQSIPSYSVTINTSDLLARLLDNREVEFYTEDGETVFTMWAPYMYDSASELSEDIAVELTALGNGQHIITLTPDAEWLNSPDRVYPIVIDPDVSPSRARTNIIDNTVMEGQGVQNKNLDRLYIGKKSGSRVRAYLKYNLMPTIPSGATITSATQTLYITSGTTTGATAGAYIVTGGDWAADTITWANSPTAATTIHPSINHNNFSYYRFSCLSAVQKWYTGSTIGKNANYGITVRYTDETINDYNAFYSADCSTESNRPLLEITYIVNSGGTGGGNSFDSAVALELGYAKSLNTVSAGELRYFKFTPNETASYIFQSSNSSGQPKVWLFDSNRVPQGTGSASAGTNLRYSHFLTAGKTYYIAAGHVEPQKGAYCLTVLRKATEANVENGFYYIQNRGTTLYLDIHGPVEQKYVHQWPMHTDEQEKWLIQLQSDGYWTIRSQYGDHLYIGVNDSNTGINNVQLFSSIFDQTKWNLYISYDGTFIFEPKSALGKVICAPNSYSGSEMMLAGMGDGGSCARWSFSDFSYSGPTFSALDVGDSPNDEAELFARYFSDYGYTNIGSYNNADEFIPAQTVKDLGRYSDIVYINGHGGRPPCLWVERYESGVDKVVEYLSPKKEIYSNYTHPDLEYQVGIGADWINANKTITNSDWDAGTKWAILGQCHQLAYNSTYNEAQWDGRWNSLWWARVMLGENERMHGILGYYLAAPPADVSYDRLENFLQNVENTTILNAWKKAHTNILDANTNWAMLYNSENANDRIDNFTASSTPGSTYKMYLVRREGNVVFEHADPTTCEATASINGISDNTSLHFENDVDIEAINNTYSKLQAALCVDENDSLTIGENHKITYTNLDCRLSEDNLGFALTEDGAIDTALQMLTDLDIAPEGNYRANVSVVNRYSLVFDESEPSAPETIEYVVSFYRTYNGLDVISDEEDGIVVAFNKYGITTLNYKWRDINLVSKNEFTLTKSITEDHAKEIYFNAIRLNDPYTLTSSCSQFTDPVTRMAYLQIDQEMHLVWVCAPDNGYGNHIFIDAKTGAQLNI